MTGKAKRLKDGDKVTIGWAEHGQFMGISGTYHKTVGSFDSSLDLRNAYKTISGYRLDIGNFSVPSHLIFSIKVHVL